MLGPFVVTIDQHYRFHSWSTILTLWVYLSHASWSMC